MSASVIRHLHSFVANSYWRLGMTTLEIDVGDLQARAVEGPPPSWW